MKLQLASISFAIISLLFIIFLLLDFFIVIAVSQSTYSVRNATPLSIGYQISSIQQADNRWMPAAAVAVGTGMGLLGALYNKLSAFFLSLRQQASEWVSKLAIKWAFIDKMVDFVQGFVKSYVQRNASLLEISLRGVRAEAKKAVIMGVSLREMTVAGISVVLLGLAFVLAKRYPLLPQSVALFILIAGVATVAHELAHMYVASRYRVATEYKFWGLGTIAMFITSLFLGTVFAQPARTIINATPGIDRRIKGIIAYAGPLASLAFVVLFLMIMLFGQVIVWIGGTLVALHLSFLVYPRIMMTSIGNGLLGVGLLGIIVNLLACVYNLMPFEPMEGRKVYDWNKPVWAATFFCSLIIYIILIYITI